MSGLRELQTAIYNKLDGASALTSQIQGIYDNPTQVANPSDNGEYPFVTISDVSGTAWDTDTEIGTTADVTVHVWSRAHHALETKEIQQAIYDALHRATLTISGYTFIGCDLLSATVERDQDGITRHGVQEFRIVFDE